MKREVSNTWDRMASACKIKCANTNTAELLKRNFCDLGKILKRNIFVMRIADFYAFFFCNEILFEITSYSVIL